MTQAQRSPHLNACDSDGMAARPHNVRLHVDQVHNDDAFTAAGVIHHDVAALDVTEPQAPVVPPLERLDKGGQTRSVPRAEASSMETDPQTPPSPPPHHTPHNERGAPHNNPDEPGFTAIRIVHTWATCLAITKSQPSLLHEYMKSLIVRKRGITTADHFCPPGRLAKSRSTRSTGITPSEGTYAGLNTADDWVGTGQARYSRCTCGARSRMCAWKRIGAGPAGEIGTHRTTLALATAPYPCHRIEGDQLSRVRGHQLDGHL